MQKHIHNLISQSLLITFLILTTIFSVQAQKNLEGICDDWKQQTANYIVVGYTSDNEDDYIWEEKSNQLQGIHIYVNPPEVVPIYIQLDNNVINFSTRSAPVGLAYTWMKKVRLSVNNGDYFEIYSGSSETDVVWYNSSDYFPTLGDHSLKVNVTDEFGATYNREYQIKVIPASTKLYKDNFGNTLRMWSGNNSFFNTPFLFSEGFDAYETSTQEMYYYLAQDLVSCITNNGFDMYLLDNRFGTQDISNNAAGFNSVVRYISQENNDIPIIAGGVSMGGLISRYGFAKAEEEGNPLPAYIFISVDSPQQGAVISKSLQDYKKEKQAGDGFAEHGLNNDAAKQLLNYSTYDPSGDIHNAFFSEINSLNGDGYPHLTQKNIGVSFSNDAPNPETGKWLDIKWDNGPFSGEEESFDLEDEEKVAGSYLPIDLTATSPMTMQAFHWLWDAVIQPLNYVVVTITRHKDPTFIPYTSALDIVNGQSKFNVVIETNQVTHHDVLPPDIIEPIVTELLLTEKFIQNITIDFDADIVGSTVFAGNKVTELVPYGDVIINNGANVQVTGSEAIILKEGVIVRGESTRLLLKIDENYTASCGSKDYMNSTNTSNNTSNAQKSNFTDLTWNEKQDEEMSIFPNPTDGNFTIECSYDIQSIEIINSNNQLKKQILITNTNENSSVTKFDINICDLPSGLYLVKVVTKEKCLLGKVIAH